MLLENVMPDSIRHPVPFEYLSRKYGSVSLGFTQTEYITGASKGLSKQKFMTDETLKRGKA